MKENANTNITITIPLHGGVTIHESIAGAAEQMLVFSGNLEETVEYFRRRVEELIKEGKSITASVEHGETLYNEESMRRIREMNESMRDASPITRLAPIQTRLAEAMMRPDEK